MLNTFRYRFAHTRLIVFFGLLYAVSQIALGIMIHHLDTLLFLKAQTTFSVDLLKGLLIRWDQAGLMPHYRHHFYLDFFHPFWYAMFLAAFLAKAMNLNHLSDKFTPLLLIPMVAGIMDLVENCFHVLYISDIAAITSWQVVVSALAANVKWGLAGLSVAGIVFLLVRYLRTPHN